MSRLSTLLRQLEAKDPQLAADLRGEVDALSARRAFGLNFERHIPETVELPGRPVRRGDKVRVLPRRGEAPIPSDRRLWRVSRIHRTSEGDRKADLASNDEADASTRSCLLDDLIVVAEFRDPVFPGLVSTGKVERGGDRPFHTVINAENFHALQLLQYTHEGRIDAIYIDPPYNSGAKDWKYNNDYVDSEDAYRHSKWLAMMERRLRLAKSLLNPAGSVLIVTIDEREVHRLALLLEQVFEDAEIQMVTSVISAKAAIRKGRFSRVEEHIFVLTLGEAVATPWMRNMLDPIRKDRGGTAEIEWLGLRRREPSSVRGTSPNQFYPIFVDEETNAIHSIGDALPDGIDRASVVPPSGTRAEWPLKKADGTEMVWGLTPKTLRANWRNGYVRLSPKGVVQYLPGGTIAEIRDGAIAISGRGRDGSVKGTRYVEDESPKPKRVWHVRSHNAETGGTRMLSKLIPGRQFQYPKSLFAIEDVLRFYVGSNLNAIILDFFAGSGTTAHAVMRLNRQDGGRRKSISVTNNEVSQKEEGRLRKAGLRPGDADWERVGICEYITKPRLRAAVTGVTCDGTALAGNYGYTDEFPLSEGFKENVEFFTMTYQGPRVVTHNRAFRAIAPLLWLRAGSQGRRIEVPCGGYDVAETYGVLFDLDAARGFLSSVHGSKTVRIAFIVTDDELGFQAVSGELPARVESIRLYESYLNSFTINLGSL